MVHPLLVSLGLIVAQASPPPDAGAVLAAVVDNFNGVKDVHFLYEGKTREINTPAAEVGRRPNPSTRDFQGVFAYRFADGAAGWEIYEDAPETELPQQHRIYALIGRRMEQVNRFADLDRGPPTAAKVQGSIHDIDQPYSPLKFMLFWRLLAASQDPGLWDFQVVGSEAVEGHPCAIVEMNILEGANFPGRPILRLWLDLEAGAMPRKVERRAAGAVTQRIAIELIKFPHHNGGGVWFPIHATIDSFSLSGEKPGAPYFHEETYVLAGSLKFDLGLTDKDFSIRPTSRIFSASKVLDSAKRYKATPPAVADVELDPASIRDRLATRLEEADAQSKVLEASTAAEVESPMNRARLALVVVGCLAIAAGVAWKSKSRRTP